MSQEKAKFVDLQDFEEDYQILDKYPFTIKRKDNNYIVKDSFNKSIGYITVQLNGKNYYKHRIIAKQFLPNPNNYNDIDHKNHDRTDYHLENLRFVSRSENNKNKSSHRGVTYRFVDSIPETSMKVDF